MGSLWFVSATLGPAHDMVRVTQGIVGWDVRAEMTFWCRVASATEGSVSGFVNGKMIFPCQPTSTPSGTLSKLHGAAGTVAAPAHTGVRASAVDRERTVGVLRQGYCADMLSLDELEHRSGEAYGSRTVRQLEQLVRDIVIGHPQVVYGTSVAIDHSRVVREVPEGVLASFMRRACAFSLDWVIVAVIAAVCGHVNPILPALPVLMYFPLSWFFSAATPAQRMMGIRVVDAQSKKKMGLMQAVSRWFALFLASPYLVCALPILWDSKRQGWHDRIARTEVIRR
ncbi:MAG TPA: RDD family protein [Chloroflexota bacterium]|nr:RDD family protein [Chloroflexota bacterium]